MDGRHQNRSGCRGYKHIDTKDIVSLYLGGQTMNEIAESFGISSWTVLDRLGKADVKKHKVYSLNHASFSVVNEESCFWAGFISARGYSANARISRSKSNIGFEVSEGFSHYLVELVEFMKSNLPTRKVIRKGKTYATLAINSEQMAKDLWKNFGIDIKDKSKSNGMVFDYDDEFVTSFLRGYLDASISLTYKISSNTQCLRVSSRSSKIIEGMLDYCRNLKIKPICYDKGKYYEVTFYTNQVSAFLREIFDNDLGFLSEYNKSKLNAINEKIKHNKKEFNKKSSARVREKRRNNIQVRLISACRKRLWEAFSRKGLKKNKNDHTIDLIGCSGGELVEYLERKFKPGMTRNNYGKWHIDHIRPLVSFDLTDQKQLKEACHYTNLQPLWAEENLSKGAKYNQSTNNTI